MNIQHLPLQLGLGVALAVAGVIFQTPQAQAQTGNQSDVTGAIITTSDIVGGHSSNPSGGGEIEVVYITNPVEQAVYSAASTVNEQLEARNLPIIATDSPRAIPAVVQENLQILVTSTGNVDASQAQIANALINAGVNPTLAQNLASSLQGLTSGGRVDAAQFRAVVEAYNALISASNAELLREPPEELRAIRSLLAILLNAGYAVNR